MSASSQASEQQRSGQSGSTSARMRSPSTYPGRARANAACACRHLRSAGRREPPMPSSSDARPSRPRRSPASSRRTARCSSVAARSERGELGVLVATPAPALDAAGRLDAGERGDQMRAGQVVGRRERLAVRVVRLLLGDRGQAERAADGDAPERARSSAELARDDAAVIHRPGDYAARGATPGCP